jgi:hypothetical protein
VRLTIRLSDDLAQQLSAISAERGRDMSAVAREALAAYLTAPAGDRPKPPPSGQAPRLAHSLDECMATLLRHWPPEIHDRLTAEMAPTDLSLRQLLLGIVFAWAQQTSSPSGHMLTREKTVMLQKPLHEMTDTE